jgi:hypothetical protein
LWRREVYGHTHRWFRFRTPLHLLDLPDARAVAVTSTPDAFRSTHGADKLATYRFNTMAAEHHFCSVCGIYTHHKRRSNPNQLGINVACLEGESPFDFSEVVIFDGSRHPADDAGHETYVAGVLRFDPASGA